MAQACPPERKTDRRGRREKEREEERKAMRTNVRISLSFTCIRRRSILSVLKVPESFDINLEVTEGYRKESADTTLAICYILNIGIY